ncbi:3-methyl-2-oxobutanoate hydroxymethyltransferase [Cyberlindnera fabianii]|uniref:3-methyl-2-oxobutanoate hydroxymethyltransferase n=1 Tax=Cyberlindnera fabianii TaxID=36022 RepID=A0A1V2L4G2_CYBFA|nr:3-methyl-2-oxobutanoate hydroxymethyltransferase [Cyberlindnera fabianii]
MFPRRLLSLPTRAFHSSSRTLSAHNFNARPTIAQLHALHAQGIKLAVVTAHDYISGRHANDAGADIVLVGDSLAMVALGYQDTNELEFDEFLYHCKAVSRGVTDSFVIADMPFGTYESSVSKAVETAIQLIGKGRANAVKLEGGVEITDTIKALTKVGIPVMGHVGLTPQRSNALSGFKVQGRTSESAKRVLEDALAVQDAGAFSVVLEAIPEKIASLITDKLEIPTIGIGAGAGTSGQVLVQADLLGMLNGHVPKFVKKYADGYTANVGAIKQYVSEVKTQQFPQQGTHTYKIKDEQLDAFLHSLKSK